MPTPSSQTIQLSVTIAAKVKASEVHREPELNAKTPRTTNKKLYNQLQNSLWLRNCSGRIAFMLYSQLQNSTKFHFGKTITNKSIRITRQQDQQEQKFKSKNQQKHQNICKKQHHRFGILKGNNISKDTDQIQAKDNNGIDIGGATEKEAQLLSKWIHSSSSASSGTVIPRTWQ